MKAPVAAYLASGHVFILHMIEYFKKENFQVDWHGGHDMGTNFAEHWREGRHRCRKYFKKMWRNPFYVQSIPPGLLLTDPGRVQVIPTTRRILDHDLDERPKQCPEVIISVNSSKGRKEPCACRIGTENALFSVYLERLIGEILWEDDFYQLQQGLYQS